MVGVSVGVVDVCLGLLVEIIARALVVELVFNVDVVDFVLLGDCEGLVAPPNSSTPAPAAFVELVDPVVVRLVSFVLVELVEVVVAVDVELVTLLIYMFNLFPAPQYVNLSPGHKKLQSLSLTFLPGVAPVFPSRLRTLPHQHSTPYSTPTYWKAQHFSRHISTVMLSRLSCWLLRTRPDEGSETHE